jgi:hypothetical protein
LRAVPANFQPADYNVETALALDLPLQAVKQITLKLGDFPAAQAGHMNVIALRPALVKVLLALHVHQVELVDQAMPLEQFESAIDGHAIDAGVKFARLAQNLSRVHVLLGSFDNA